MQSLKIDHRHFWPGLQSTGSQAEIHQVKVVCNILRHHARPCSVQVSEVRIVAGIERLVTHKGQTLTVTSRRTGGVTQQLIIPLWTLRPAVTQVVAMETHIGRFAPIITWAFDVITADLVLASKTVFDPVTPEIHWQTIHCLARTAKVGLWTRRVSRVHGLCGETASSIHVNDDRGHWYGGIVNVLGAVIVTQLFIAAVQTVVSHVAHFAVVNPLPIATPESLPFFVLAACFVRSVSAVGSEVTHQRVVNRFPVLAALKHLHRQRYAALSQSGHRAAS
jgi:hypothetical protein